MNSSHSVGHLLWNSPTVMAISFENVPQCWLSIKVRSHSVGYLFWNRVLKCWLSIKIPSHSVGPVGYPLWNCAISLTIRFETVPQYWLTVLELSCSVIRFETVPQCWPTVLELSCSVIRFESYFCCRLAGIWHTMTPFANLLLDHNYSRYLNVMNGNRSLSGMPRESVPWCWKLRLVIGTLTTCRLCIILY